MDAPPLSSARRRELDELRSRAYGPDADIASDADALARLIELEELARADAEVDAEAADEDVQAPVVGGAAETRAVEADADAEVSTTAGASSDAPTVAPVHRRAWWRRVPAWAYIAAATALGLAIGMMVPTLSEPHPVATLRPAPIEGAQLDFQMYGITAESPVRYDRFHDLEVWSGETTQGAVCIVVTTQSGEWMTAGCAPPPLAPTADINFYPGMRGIDGLPLDDGSVVRFILRENEIAVWVAPTDVPA